VFRGLADNAARDIETLASCASGDLLEVADGQDADFLAVEFGEAREEHCSDRDIDADAEGIRPADDLEQASLGESLDE
jgi:hypothetical protein